MSYKDLKGGFGFNISKFFRTPAFNNAIESINKFTDFLSDKYRIYEFRDKMLYFTKFSTKINDNEKNKNDFLINYVDFIKDFTEKYEKIIKSLTKAIVKYNEKTTNIDYKYFTGKILLEMENFDNNINNVMNNLNAINNVNYKNEFSTVNGENGVINGQNFSNIPITIAQPVKNNQQPYNQRYAQQNYPVYEQQYGQPQNGQSNPGFGGKRHRKNQTRRHTNRRKRSQRHH